MVLGAALAILPLGVASSARAGTASAGREVFAFFTAGGSDYMLQSADYSTLTTVAFIGVDALADGTLETSRDGVVTTQWAAWTSDWMNEVITKAHAGGCKVVLTVKRFAWSAADRALTTELLSSADARANLAVEIADAVIARGVDGVNLDFEPIPTAVKDDFVTFVRLLRQELDERQAGLFLTFDATAHIANYRIAELTAEGAADAVFVMGYPFKSSGSKKTGANSPLDGVKYGLPETVDAYLARTSADKVILGLPYYGYEWSTETKLLHSSTRPIGPTYGYPNSRPIGSAISSPTICTAVGNACPARIARDMRSSASGICFSNARIRRFRWRARRNQGTIASRKAPRQEKISGRASSRGTRKPIEARTTVLATSCATVRVVPEVLT